MATEWQHSFEVQRWRKQQSTPHPRIIPIATRKDEITSLLTYVALVRISAVGIAVVETAAASHCDRGDMKLK